MSALIPSCEYDRCGGVGEYVALVETREQHCAEDAQPQQLVLCDEHVAELEDDESVAALRVLAISV